MVAKRLRWFFGCVSIAILPLPGFNGHVRAGFIVLHREVGDLGALGNSLATDAGQPLAPLAFEHRTDMTKLLDPIDLTWLPVDPWLDASPSPLEIGSTVGQDRGIEAQSMDRSTEIETRNRLDPPASWVESSAASESSLWIVPGAMAQNLVLCLVGLLGVSGSDFWTRKIRRFVRTVNRGRRRTVYRYFH